MLPKEKLNVAAAAQTAPPTQLDPELMNFCSYLNITPAIREFHDNEDKIHPNPCVSNHSNQSSDIEEESKLKKFTQALQKAQSITLEEQNKNKKRVYTKKSKRTLQCCKQEYIKLVSNGFLPLDQYIRLKGKAEKHKADTPIPESESIINAV